MKASKKFAIRFAAVLFCFLFLFPSLSAGADELPALGQTDAVILYSVNKGEILISKNPDKLIYPSATVKIMSGLILCEELGERLDEKITITAQMLSNVSGRSFGLKVGDTLAVKDLLRIALCGSYNDAYCALSCAVGGSIDGFVALMNEKAKSLGASSTHYKNVTGIDREGMQTTSRDVLKIALAASKNKLYMNLSSTYSYTVSLNSGTTKNIENRNELHNIYGDFFNANALGFASGMTDLGGYCVATKGEFNGAEYICVVMGAAEGREYALANSLLSFASKNYFATTLKTAGTIVGSIPVTLSDTHTEIALVLGEDITVMLDKNTPADNEKSFELILSKEELKAPVQKGEQVGFMVVRSQNDIIACVPVIVAQDAQKNAILAGIEDMKSFIVSRGVIAAVSFFAAATLVFLIFCAAAKKRKRKRPVYAKGRYR